MLPDRRMPEDEVCPVRDELLGELYCAAEHGVSDLVASVASDIRALLALYCYRRSHLHTRGVAIAASCDQDDLVRWGGHVGAPFCSRGPERLRRQPPSRQSSAPAEPSRSQLVPFARCCQLTTSPTRKTASPSEPVIMPPATCPWLFLRRCAVQLRCPDEGAGVRPNSASWRALLRGEEHAWLWQWLF